MWKTHETTVISKSHDTYRTFSSTESSATEDDDTMYEKIAVFRYFVDIKK